MDLIDAGGVRIPTFVLELRDRFHDLESARIWCSHRKIHQDQHPAGQQILLGDCKVHKNRNPGALPSDVLHKSTKNNWLPAGKRSRRSVSVASLIKIGEMTKMASLSRKEDLPLQDSGNGDTECNPRFSHGLSSLELSGSDTGTAKRLSRSSFVFGYNSGLTTRACCR